MRALTLELFSSQPNRFRSTGGRCFQLALLHQAFVRLRRESWVDLVVYMTGRRDEARQGCEGCDDDVYIVMTIRLDGMMGFV